MKADNFLTSDISVLLPRELGSHDLQHTKNSKAPEGAATGAGTGAVIGGAVGGALVGMGMPEYEAKRYEGSIQNGGILFSVHAATSIMADQAKEILLSTGADDITVSTEAKGGSKSPQPPPRTRVDSSASSVQTY